MTATDPNDIHDIVREGYAKIATSETRGCGCDPGCCVISADSPEDVARAVGYGDAELATVPDGANMGLSCGNPTAIAALAEGETVLDLGSGGGFDCFVAGPRVGATGRVIGVDMTPEMIGKARRNVETYTAHTGLDNVEFRLGEIEHLPLEDASVDVVISNCVVNLSPDKPRVWREIARVLRPGGRVAISDLALLRPLPPELADDINALVGCVAGAQLVDETARLAADAGLADIRLNPRGAYSEKTKDYITSLEVTARKP